LLSEDKTSAAGGADALKLTAEIVASFVGKNPIPASELGALIRSVHETLTALAKTPAEPEPEKPKPAAPINRSVFPDYIICLEDGKKLKMLKRYLRSTYNMSPDEYRKRWGLPADYPMVAPSYAARRSETAKRIGLGRGVRRRG
jgi:predicted transcriptional regulator